MIDLEFKYFKDNKDAIYALYPNKFVIISGLKVHGAADTFNDAVDKALEKFELGTFAVQHCTEDESGYTQKFHSRAIFI